MAEDVSAQQLARDTAHSLAQQMRLWAADIGGGGCAPTVVADYFLFTFVAAVAWREQLLLFGMGDGVMGVDGALTVRDSGTDNTPAYAAYLALAPNQLEPAMSLEPWSMSAPPGWKVALIGTDGVAEVCDGARRWQQDPRYRRHPLALQRRLVVLSERERRLTDDTTAVLIHRSEA